MSKKLLMGSILSIFMAFSASVFACGGEASGKHIGSMLNVNADKSTFTIRDMETNSAITFNADADIMAEVKNASGRIMVNYEEDDEGSLVATGVAF
ncbi:MAG: hypothetical protein R3240_05815 [Gammaproteobacteria bacterium]|nr:hypothetical protein [Gammaproteobacteria bacterium]